ncbi:MAG: EGF domain-containing protein [Myxococcota bacterium]
MSLLVVGCDSKKSCEEGFIRSEGACVDVDECATPRTDNCDTLAQCTNTVGKFTCTCPAGYADINSDGTLCTDIDECAENTDSCDGVALCTNTPGSFTCSCPENYVDTVGDGTACADIDECATDTDNCDAVASCTNTAGGYLCRCPEGYTDIDGTGSDCQNINECTSETDDCGIGASCADTPGSYTCTCADGLVDVYGNGRRCDDSAACNNCSPNASCAYAVEGYACLCNFGFDGDGTQCDPTFGSCREIRERTPLAPSGLYTITTSVGEVEVYCDMQTDFGAGYTMLRIDDPGLIIDQDAYRASCAAVGLEVIVPRTRAHLFAIRAYNGDVFPNLVNIFPKFDAAIDLHNWQGLCRGEPCSFYLSDSNSAGCMDTLEPNGDNVTGYSLFLFDNEFDNDVCDSGHWNDARNAMGPEQGYVICSTNDTAPIAVQSSCRAYRDADAVDHKGPNGINGIQYMVDTGEGAFPVRCDMLMDGGGWTRVGLRDGWRAPGGVELSWCRFR